MRTISSLTSNIQRSLYRARFGILTIGIAYVASWGIGFAMVHTRNRFALAYRDRIVSKAWASSPILHTLDQGNPLAAAGLDFGANALGGRKGRKKSLCLGTGPRWAGGMAQAETSTIRAGQLVISIYDPARKELIWRGEASETLEPSKDPDKNYRNLQKAMAKLFQNYPPKTRWLFDVARDIPSPETTT